MHFPCHPENPTKWIPKENPAITLAEELHSAELGLGVPSVPSSTLAGWYSRGYLPHYDTLHSIQSVTFRLADSLPQAKLHQLEEEFATKSPSDVDRERRKRIEEWLDAGMGCCALKHPALAALLQDTLLKWHDDRYHLFAWCIMPNHLHVLMETAAPLSKIVQSWKSFTGRWAMKMNAELGLGVPRKALWMREYWDRYIRDGNHFAKVRTYIENNPVAAGLCQKPSDWPWSSASFQKIRFPQPGNAEPQLGQH